MAAKPSGVPKLPTCSCGHEIPATVTLCIVCGANAGYPNVRFAESKEEREALDRRVTDARISASARGSSQRLEAFGQAASRSEAVICRELTDLTLMLKGGGQLMQAYHPAVRAELRIPQNNEFDPSREVNDGRVSPGFYQKLHFGALSLDRRGVPHYGRYAITLKENMIAHRTTVFEENPVVFNRKHPFGRPLPYGYRAMWNERGKLAMAKLQPKIEPTTTDEDFPGILMQRTANPTGFSDFIEVHVYGPIHPAAFEHIRAEAEPDEVDRAVWNRLKERLVVFGVSFEEHPA